MQLNAATSDWQCLMAVMADTAAPAEPRPVANAEHPQLARAISGCNHARAELLREFEDGWYRFCLSLLGCPDAARDATQETATRVLRQLATFRGASRLKTWTYSIALNVCREHRRRRRWLALPAGWVGLDRTAGPARQAEASEERSRLHTLLAQLPRRQREAVTLRYLHQLSTAETAEAMRCAEGTVKATLAKALTSLRAQWEGADA